jgi:glycyl-tRNA synthetase beta chain
LALPKEVLITTMQSNQKYFPVVNANGGLLAHFITFSNLESTNPASIQRGNERVILPRFADAEFFWNQDRKQPLSARVELLKTIVFQQKLGTLFDKTQRVIKLTKLIATYHPELKSDVVLTERAAELSKADLLTNMVSEFPNLQGIMGHYYALTDGEHPDVAKAIEEQYFPKQSGSKTAESKVGQILAITDKIDTVTSIFSIGLLPTGDKDPYGLRRATLGILRTIIENNLTFNLNFLVDTSLGYLKHHDLKNYEGFDRESTKVTVMDFIFERLRGYCLEQGYSHDEFEAVIAIKPAQPLDFMQRLQAVKAFRALPEAESLAAANKRISNILKKSETPATATVGELVETAEIELLAVAKQSAADIKPLLAQGDYQAALYRLAKLKQPVDNFFDNVMVNCEDLQLRASRLALLDLLAQQFLQIADISKLQGN